MTPRLLPVLLLFTACASVPPPSERLSTAEAAIRGAVEVDANTVPRAALHLKLAQEQVDKAKHFIQDGQNERADLALRRAQADAELAVGLSRERDMVEKARAVEARAAKLKSTKAM